MNPTVHNLANLPTEILSRIANELVADSYKTDHISFGPSLRSLALVCKRFTSICTPLRYYDWELVSEGPFSRLKEHLELPAWRSSVKVLTVPVRDLRSDDYIQDIDLETYDATLAKIIASIDSLIRLTLAFDYWDILDSGSRPILPKTVEACLLRTEVHDITLFGISSRSACEDARYIIAGWHGLRCLRIWEFDPNEDPAEQDKIVRLLWTVATQGKGVERLEWDMNLRLEDVDQDTALELPAAQAQLRSLNLSSAGCRAYCSSPPILYKMLRSVGNISSLSIDLEDLDASTRRSSLSLSFPRLRQLQLQISRQYGQTESDARRQYSSLASHLRKHHSLLSKDSLLEYLHLTGENAMLFFDALGRGYPDTVPPLLKSISLCKHYHAFHEAYRAFDEARDACGEVGIHLYETYRALYPLV